MPVDPRGHVTALMLAASIAVASPWVVQGQTAQDAGRRQDCLTAPTAACLFAEAERIASSIDNQSLRAMALATIAAEYGHAAIEDAALKAKVTLLRARMEVPDRDATPPDLLGFVWNEIADAEAELGDLDAALATASGIGDEDMRDTALTSIAGIRASKNDIVGALLSAARINDPTYHALALREIAHAQAEMGDLAGSLETARDIEPPWARDSALLIIALTFAHDGHRSEALEAAAGIEREPLRAWVASLTEARAGNIERALRIASGIDDSRWRVLGDIAQALAERGDVAGSLRIANSIEDARDRSDALAGIAEAQADRGDFAGALRTSRTIENVLRPLELRARAVASGPLRIAVANIAVRQAGSGDPTGAVLSARLFLHGRELAEALARIATAISRTQ